MGKRTEVCPGLPRFFTASVLSFPAALVNTFVCAAARYEVMSPNPPDQTRLVRNGAPSSDAVVFTSTIYESLNFSCFVTSRWPSLQDSVTSAGACRTAPASGTFPAEVISNSALFAVTSCCGSSSAREKGQLPDCWAASACTRSSVRGGLLSSVNFLSCQLRSTPPRLEISTRYRSLSITTELSALAARMVKGAAGIAAFPAAGTEVEGATGAGATEFVVTAAGLAGGCCGCGGL